MTKNETSTPQEISFEEFKDAFLLKNPELDVPIYQLPDECGNLKNLYGELCFIVLGIPLSLTELIHKESPSDAETYIEVRIKGVRDEDFFFIVKDTADFLNCAKEKVLQYLYDGYIGYLKVPFIRESSLNNPMLVSIDSGFVEKITVNNFINYYDVSLVELFIYIVFFKKINILKKSEYKKRKIYYKNICSLDEFYKINQEVSCLSIKSNFEKVNQIGKYNAIMINEDNAKINNNILLSGNKRDYTIELFYSKLGTNTNIDLKIDGDRLFLSIQDENDINYFEKCKLNLEYREKEILSLIGNLKLPFFGDSQKILHFQTKRFNDIKTIKLYSLLLYNLDNPKNTINNTSKYINFIEEELRASLYDRNYLRPEEDFTTYSTYDITLQNIYEYGITLDRVHRKIIYDADTVKKIHKHIKDNFYFQEFGDDHTFFGKTIKQIVNFKVHKYIKNIYKHKEIYQLIDGMIKEKFNGELLLKNFPWGINDDEFSVRNQKKTINYYKNEVNKKNKNQKRETLEISLYLYIIKFNEEINSSNFYMLIGIISLLLNVDNRGDSSKNSQRETIKLLLQNNKIFKYWYEYELIDFLPVTENKNIHFRELKKRFNKYIDDNKLCVMKVKVNDTSDSDSSSEKYYDKLYDYSEKR